MKIKTCAMLGAILIVTTQTVYADPMSSEAVHELVSGRSMALAGDWGSAKGGFYFAPSGSVTLFWEGRTEEGRWSISGNSLCISDEWWGDNWCIAFEATRAEGRYRLSFPEGNTATREVEDFVEGNNLSALQ